MTTASHELFENGEAHRLRGQFDIAEPLFREAVLKWTGEDGVKLEEVQYSWARCLHAQQRYDEVETVVLQNLSDTAAPLWAFLFKWLYADIMFSQFRFEKAGEMYWSTVETSIEEDPDTFIEFDDVNVFTDMWTCFYITESPDKVEQMLPYLPFDDESIAQLLVQIALPHTSHENRSPKYGGPNVQIPLGSCARCLELSYRLNPIADTLITLGRHLYGGGQMAEAVAVYRQIESSFPSVFDEDSSRTFGWALQELGLLDEAETWLRKSALEYCPDDYMDVEPLITFYEQYQRWIDAREVLEIHISARLFKPQLNYDGNLVEAWAFHARCSELLGEHQKAEASRLQVRIHLEQLLRHRIATSERYPNVAITHFGLAECLKHQGRVVEAEASFNIAKQMFIAETKDGGDKWWGHHWLGRFYEEHEDFELAEAHFQVALRLASPASHLDNSSLGRVLVKRGHLDKAEHLLRTNSDMYSKYWLGRCLLARGMTNEAERLFAEVTEKDPFVLEYTGPTRGFTQEMRPRW
jgi:tetratricopeptide (TPR) repeat protein